MTHPQLKDVPETMLWTLHNRATEAARQDGIIKDDKAIEIYRAIDYDYEKSFGKAEPSHAIRSLIFDEGIRRFLARYPHACIVNLGEGLETQRFRFKNDQATWISVDLPEAIAIRERFIPADERHLHVSVSALDRAWFELVPKDQALFVTAQGLFMYLKKEEVKSLILDIINTFSKGGIMFDTIPIWLSKKTMSAEGWKKTTDYVTPPMPWGINRDQIPTIKQWSPKIQTISEQPYRFPRGIIKWIYNTYLSIPILNRYAPCMVQLEFE
ncbi:MAG: class I SAM-dependent methyltransferase [Bacteroidota bacterium]